MFEALFSQNIKQDIFLLFTFMLKVTVSNYRTVSCIKRILYKVQRQKHTRDGHGVGSRAERIRSPVTFFGSGTRFEFLGKNGFGFGFRMYAMMFIECM